MGVVGLLGCLGAPLGSPCVRAPRIEGPWQARESSFAFGRPFVISFGLLGCRPSGCLGGFWGGWLLGGSSLWGGWPLGWLFGIWGGWLLGTAFGWVGLWVALASGLFFPLLGELGALLRSSRVRTPRMGGPWQAHKNRFAIGGPCLFHSGFGGAGLGGARRPLGRLVFGRSACRGVGHCGGFSASGGLAFGFGFWEGGVAFGRRWLGLFFSSWESSGRSKT